jgi:hypothetical protein
MQSSDSTILSSRIGKNFSKQKTTLQQQICEAYGCDKRATRQVTVNVGNMGSVGLNLCGNCIPKFSDSNDSNTVTKNGSRVHSLPMDDKKGCFNNEYTTAYLSRF